MKQKRTVYPYFVANQVLKSKSLNDAFFHLDEQGRVTRTNLFGHGIIEGLTYTWKDGVLTIDRGEAITSNGWYIQFPRKQEYRYAAEVFLGENPAEEVYPFNDDSLLALLKYGGSRVCYACFKTKEEAHEFHHNPTPIIEIPSAHYVVAMVCGTRNHSRSACTEDSCDINVTQKDCEAWPVLVNIYATFKYEERVNYAFVLPIYKVMEPCCQRVQLMRFDYLRRSQSLSNLKDYQWSWIVQSMEVINNGAITIARDILGQNYDFTLKESIKVRKSIWKNLFDKPREVISRFRASVIKVNRIFTNNGQGLPDYCLTFLRDYADAMMEFIEEYNLFVAKHPYLPLRDPLDCLVYLGSARELDNKTGASYDQTYRSHFRKAHDEGLKEDALRLERFLRRISLLTEAFVGTSWHTIDSPMKMFNLVPCRPEAKISDRPIPFYYNASYENFKRCWRAGNISEVSFVYDHGTTMLPYIKREKLSSYYFFSRVSFDNGTKLYPQGYQGMTVSLFISFIYDFIRCNGADIQIEVVKLYSKKDIDKNPYLAQLVKEPLFAEPMGGWTRYCSIIIYQYKGKVVTYAVGRLVK